MGRREFIDFLKDENKRLSTLVEMLRRRLDHYEGKPRFGEKKDDVATISQAMRKLNNRRQIKYGKEWLSENARRAVTKRWENQRMHERLLIFAERQALEDDLNAIPAPESPDAPQ